jgi:AbrB family looped-hinge helix DNA binding protein
MAIATVSAKGWVVLPQEIRRKYGLKNGDKVHVIDFGGLVSIVPVAKEPILAWRGFLKGGPSLTQGLLEDRREELDREERRLPSPRRSSLG